MRHRVHEVGFAQTRLPVEKDRVVSSRGRVGHGDAGRVGELVARPDDEVFKRVARVERQALVGCYMPCTRAARRGVQQARDGHRSRRGGGRDLHRQFDGLAGGLVQASLEQVAVVFLDPNQGEVTGQSKHDGVGVFRQAHNRLKPGLVNFTRKKGLKIALQSCPQGLWEGFRGHSGNEAKGLDIHTKESRSYLSQIRPGSTGHEGMHNSLSALKLNHDKAGRDKYGNS